MTKTKKIVLAIVAVAVVALLAFAAVNGGHLATAACVDCGGAGLVDDAACETCAGEGNVTASWWALVPPVIAIGLALITKEVYSSLFIGIVAGAILGSNFSFTGTMDLITGNALIDAVSGTAGIFIFLVVLGVLVALVNKAGGSAAFGAWAEKHIKSRTGA
ncbi:MAG: Na+/H+ antiporter NhaC family protein, partial [Clostridia bacterium]|nr:Na+/H+ antiporter NhaC family protein [Clostridia bacterium]